ncbi:glutathione peroxidase [Oxalicibacterium solurbis]|uniref:Glutathione peroxidase n=2 Tax=Oxalicibacterium solurbis TaxID=69280 RepID=A0A8J3F8I7_9BURK|nr:glutathione peroxidase [Oxalicibacterium solurbis]
MHEARQNLFCLILSLIIVDMNDTTQRPALPDRLSIDPRSPYYDAAIFEHQVGIRLNDKERSDVEEYCISEGWVKVPAGKALDRKGNPLLTKLKGKVEAFYR